MKPTKLLLFVLGLFLFTSCGDDPTSEELIIGAWDISSITASNCDDPDDNDIQNFECDTIFESTICSSATLVFTAPSTAVFNTLITQDGQTVSSESDSGTYSFSDNGLLTICILGDCEEGSLSITEQSMTWSITDSNDGCNITIVGGM